MMQFEELLNQKIELLPPSRVREAMRYSLLAGGKRLRPMMLYATVEGFNLSKEEADDFACALEMIHTYSLIHDDLPAMDNDDLRRGKPTCHKQFDEATAILAGDGLLTYAFEIASNSKVNQLDQCIHYLANYAGAGGMILGQCLDIEERQDLTWEDLKRIHYYKTGCLFAAPLAIGALIANQNEDLVKEFDAIGKDLGLAFQIQDDLLDIHASMEELGKSTSDARNGKITSVSILSDEKANIEMNRLYNDCMTRLQQIEGFDAKYLISIVKEVITRKK